MSDTTTLNLDAEVSATPEGLTISLTEQTAGLRAEVYVPMNEASEALCDAFVETLPEMFSQALDAALTEFEGREVAE